MKLYLFKSYCLQIYGADLWLDYKGALGVLKQFAVGYHGAIKKLLGLSSHESNHYACQEARMLIFKHFVNKARLCTSMRLFSTPCSYFMKILPFLRISSVIRSKIEEVFEREYDTEYVFENDFDAVLARIIYVQNHEETMR